MAKWRSRLSALLRKEARSDDVRAVACAGLASADRQHTRSRFSGDGFFVGRWRIDVKKLPERSGLKEAKLRRSRRRREELSSRRKVADRRAQLRHNDLLPKLDVEYVPIDELRQPQRRTRKENSEQIARIAASISELGFNQPVLARGAHVIDGWLRMVLSV